MMTLMMKCRLPHPLLLSLMLVLLLLSAILSVEGSVKDGEDGSAKTCRLDASGFCESSVWNDEAELDHFTSQALAALGAIT